MDQLMAYRVLGLEPGCSLGEIKEAYAALSKQYHPEEQPEKFQEIHEAYVTLTRRKRHPSEMQGMPQGMQDVFVKEENEQLKEKKKTEYDFNHIEIEHSKQERQDYSFEEAMKKAKVEEQERLHELTLQAIAEINVLVSPKYKNNLKMFKKFFGDKKYSVIIKRGEFLGRLADVLEQSKIKKGIYSYIIDFYRLRGLNPSELAPEELRLYQVLDEKAGVVKTKIHPALLYGVPTGFIAGFRAFRGIIKPFIRENETFAVIALGIFVVVFLILLYMKLYENHSSVFAQAVVAVIIQVSQFLVIMSDFYGTAFGTVDDGNSLAAVIFLLAGVWLFVLGIIAIIRLVRNIVGFLKL